MKNPRFFLIPLCAFLVLAFSNEAAAQRVAKVKTKSAVATAKAKDKAKTWTANGVEFSHRQLGKDGKQGWIRKSTRKDGATIITGKANGKTISGKEIHWFKQWVKDVTVTGPNGNKIRTTSSSNRDRTTVRTAVFNPAAKRIIQTTKWFVGKTEMTATREYATKSERQWTEKVGRPISVRRTGKKATTTEFAPQ